MVAVAEDSVEDAVVQAAEEVLFRLKIQRRTTLYSNICNYLSGRGGGGGGRGGFNNNRFSRDDGPKNIIPLGFYDYPCQEDLVAKVEVENVPFFNAPIYIEGEKQIGKVDEIFGHLRDFYVSIKLMDNMKPDGFQPKQKLFIDSAKLLPLARFLPGNQTRKPAGRVGKPGGRGGGGRGGPGGGFRYGLLICFVFLKFESKFSFFFSF